MRLLRLPGRIGRSIWGFMNPSRTAGRVPYGRFAIVVQLLAALIFLGYTFTKKSLPLPFSASSYEVEVIFPDAQGLDRVDDPGVAVAGALLGRVTDVRYDPVIGAAVATMTLKPEVRGKIFADATAAIRPGSAIQNLVVNVDPGTPSAGPLPDDQPIPPEHTTGFVAIDELTSVLDADTRAYVQILVGEAHRALRGRETELRQVLNQVGHITGTTTPIARALATRRELLTQLVGDLDQIFTVLGERGAQLSEAIAAGNRTLQVTAARDEEVAELIRRLAPTLVEADRSLAAVNGLTRPLLPALEQLAPAASELGAGLQATRTLVPPAATLVDVLGRLVKRGSRPLELALEGTAGLPSRVSAEVPVARDLSALTRRLDHYKQGVAQLADTLSGALSVNDRGGTYGQVDVLKIETPKPENLGLPASAAAKLGQGHSRLELRLAAALERACRQDSLLACLIRFELPGVEGLPVHGQRGKGG